MKIKGERNQREHLKLAKIRRVCKNQKELLERLKIKKNGKNEDSQEKLWKMLKIKRNCERLWKSGENVKNEDGGSSFQIQLWPPPAKSAPFSPFYLLLLSSDWRWWGTLAFRFFQILALVLRFILYSWLKLMKCI